MSEQIPDISGRIVEVGRVNGVSEIVIEVAKGQQVTVRGISDAVAKQFARNLYAYVRVEFGVQVE